MNGSFFSKASIWMGNFRNTGSNTRTTITPKLQTSLPLNPENEVEDFGSCQLVDLISKPPRHPLKFTCKGI